MPIKSISDLAESVHRQLKKTDSGSPGISLLTRILEVVYLTSLKTEEGRPLQVRVAIVDPSNPDPSRPPRPRPTRWKITKLGAPLPFSVPVLVKLCKAADPWSSSIAAYYDTHKNLVIWGLIDQTVHFNTRLVHESEGGYAPPGEFQVLATGTADLSVYREYSFIARLSQDVLLTKQNDVFGSGPVSARLDEGISRYLSAVWGASVGITEEEFNNFAPSIAETWIGTLCRLLISIQRYRHGGALLITRSRKDLEIKYHIKYDRLPRALRNLWKSRLAADSARQEIFTEYLDKVDDYIPAITYLDETVYENDSDDFQEEITGCVRFVASLSCVDGLILATPDLTIRGFGVEITTKEDVPSLYLVRTPTLRTNSLSKVDPNHYGTRHRSMMRYCFSNPKSLGFVVSQDGEIRALRRVGSRILMWENLKVLSFLEQPTRPLTRPTRKRPKVAD